MPGSRTRGHKGGVTPWSRDRAARTFDPRASGRAGGLFGGNTGEEVGSGDDPDDLAAVHHGEPIDLAGGHPLDRFVDGRGWGDRLDRPAHSGTDRRTLEHRTASVQEPRVPGGGHVEQEVEYPPGEGKACLLVEHSYDVLLTEDPDRASPLRQDGEAGDSSPAHRGRRLGEGRGWHGGDHLAAHDVANREPVEPQRPLRNVVG